MIKIEKYIISDYTNAREALMILDLLPDLSTRNLFIVNYKEELIGTITDVGAKLVVNGSTQLGSSTVYINTGNDASGNYIETVGNTSNTRAIRIQGINNAGTAYSAVKIASGISKIQLQIDDVIKMEVKSNTINIASIPTSSAGLSSGDIYSNAGILTIVP